MPPTRLHLKSAFVLLCLVGTNIQAKTPLSAIDDTAYNKAPGLNSVRTGWYHESGSDSHLMFGKKYGITFEDHKMSRQLTSAGTIALLAAIAGRIPDFIGYDTRTWTGKIITSLPVMLWPTLVGKKNLGTFQQ